MCKTGIHPKDEALSEMVASAASRRAELRRRCADISGTDNLHPSVLKNILLELPGFVMFLATTNTTDSEMNAKDFDVGRVGRLLGKKPISAKIAQNWEKWVARPCGHCGTWQWSWKRCGGSQWGHM